MIQPDAVNGYHYYPEPRPELRALLGLLAPDSSVVDLGAGFGNNTQPLLRAGHRVLATEINGPCLDHLHGLIKQYPGRLRVERAPLQAWTATNQFDGVVCTMVLHFLTPGAGLQALRAMQQATKPGGLNLVSTYLADSALSSEYDWQLQPQQLRALYAGWEVLDYDERFPFTVGRIRTLPQLTRWLRGRRGYKSARVIARKIA